MKILGRSEIEAVLEDAQLDLVRAVEDAFVAYSRGEAVVPPVGELLFDEVGGEAHIKYGYLRGGRYYVVKVASGFPRNRDLGLEPNNGLMLLFDLSTGAPIALLADEGRLTDERTAAAGAVAAKHLAPSNVERIGIVGTGVQARLQLSHLMRALDERPTVTVWGRRQVALDALRADVAAKVDAQIDIRTTTNIAELADCQLIVTTTAAREPLLDAGFARPGLHITAVGSDTPHKQELSSELVQRADVLVCDSESQCRSRGEIARASERRSLDPVELGAVLAGRAAGRTSDEQFTICDLTGVAVQDLLIAQTVYEAAR